MEKSSGFVLQLARLSGGLDVDSELKEGDAEDDSQRTKVFASPSLLSPDPSLNPSCPLICQPPSTHAQ